MFAIIDQNFKAIASLTIMLLMGLALFAGQARSAEGADGPAPSISIETSIRHNGE